jgi:hypothetical protein
MGNSFFDLFANVSFWAALLSWALAQCTKMFCALYRTGRLDFSYLASTGGMPSAHSAMVSGLAASIGFGHGFDSSLFVLALAFALIVMFDASTVRRAAGMQASLLNDIVDELFKEHRLSEQKLAELLGHTRLEVFMGMLMGVLVAMFVNSGFVLYW